MAGLYKSFRLPAEASQRYLKSFEWQPTQLAALGVARSLHEQSKGIEAIKFLRAQLFHFPDWIEGRILLGRILHELGQMSDAQKEWQSVLRQDQDNREALDLLRGALLG
jgi:hypothetical protein